MKEPEFVQLVGMMDMVVLKQSGDGGFHMVSPAPPWFERFRPLAFPEGPAFHPERLSPVLEDFTEEAREVWEGGGKQARPKMDSGWWTQRDRDGRLHFIRATAVRLSKHNYLVLEQGARDAQLFAALQQYKNGMFEYENMQNDLRQRAGDREQAVEWSPVDQVTGLRNRDSFFSEAPGFLNNAKINRRPLYVFVIRLAGIKIIREKFGPAEESAALFAASEILRKTFRKLDLRARFPNNAFVVAAMETHFDFRKILEDRLNKNVEKYNTASFKAYELKLKVGVIRHDYKESASMAELIKMADEKIRSRNPENGFSAGPIGVQAPPKVPVVQPGSPKPGLG